MSTLITYILGIFTSIYTAAMDDMILLTGLTLGGAILLTLIILSVTDILRRMAK